MHHRPDRGFSGASECIACIPFGLEFLAIAVLTPTPVLAGSANDPRIIMIDDGRMDREILRVGERGTYTGLLVMDVRVLEGLYGQPEGQPPPG